MPSVSEIYYAVRTARLYLSSASLMLNERADYYDRSCPFAKLEGDLAQPGDELRNVCKRLVEMEDVSNSDLEYELANHLYKIRRDAEYKHPQRRKTKMVMNLQWWASTQDIDVYKAFIASREFDEVIARVLGLRTRNGIDRGVGRVLDAAAAVVIAVVLRVAFPGPTLADRLRKISDNDAELGRYLHLCNNISSKEEN